MTEPVWDLFRKGYLDQERHHDIVRRAIEERLGDLISDASILDGSGQVRIPIRELKEHHFRYADGEGEGMGSGRPGTRKGDVIGRLPPKGPGKGEAGDEHEEGHYQVWVSAEEVVKALFTNLELPNIRPKQKSPVTDEEPVYKDIRKKGPLGTLSLRHTMRANLKRNAILGHPGFGGLTDDDLRFRAPDMQQQYKDQCLMICIRDRSGSMDEGRKERSKLGAFWTKEFLRSRYGPQVEVVYILHDTQAEVVTEERFFGETEGGGTNISSGITLAADLIRDKYPPDCWNIYTSHFTDGDNTSSDNERAAEKLLAIAPHLNLYAYWLVDEGPGSYSGSEFGTFLRTKTSHPVIEYTHCRSKTDIPNAIRHFFRKRGDGKS